MFLLIWGEEVQALPPVELADERVQVIDVVVEDMKSRTPTPSSLRPLMTLGRPRQQSALRSAGPVIVDRGLDVFDELGKHLVQFLRSQVRCRLLRRGPVDQLQQLGDGVLLPVDRDAAMADAGRKVFGRP